MRRIRDLLRATIIGGAFWLGGGAVFSASLAAPALHATTKTKASLKMALNATPTQTPTQTPVQRPTRTLIKIGVLAFAGEESSDRWQSIAEYLSRIIPIYEFTITPLDHDNIDTAIFGSEVDFLLTNPASYADLEAAYGVTRLVTVRNLRPGGAYTQFGAVIFARSDRQDIHSLDDLRGKSFAAVHANAFGGWWMAWREMLDQGVDPKSDLARLEFTGFPQDKIVFAVRDGHVDAGTVRTDVLERMAGKGLIAMDEFRILNPQTTANFPLQHSTRLYPEWPLALVNQKLTGLAQEVSVALLSMPASAPEAVAARIFGWTVPLDYNAVHELMRELHVGPYRSLGEINLRDVFSLYWHWLLIGLLTLALSIGTTAYVLPLNARLKKSTAALEGEIVQRTQAQQTSAAQAKRIRALYSVASRSGLSFDTEVTEVLRVGCALLGLEIGKINKIDTALNRSEIVSVFASDNYKLRAGDVMLLDTTYCIVPSISKRPFAIEHAGRSKWRDLPFYASSGIEAYIAAPVWVNNQFYGTLSYASRQPRAEPFQETDSDLVRLMGRWVGVTLERATQQQELDQARTLAETASHAKSDFLARMSHELRTPLNAILGYSEMIIEDFRDSGKAQQVTDLSRIHASGRQLLGLINDILDLAKIESGKVELIYSRFEVRASVEDVIATVQPLAAKNRNKIAIEFGDHTGVMTADEGKVRQALLNILSNACKFTENGCITLRAQRQTENKLDWIVYSISDTGIGMTPAQIKRLFHDFSQASVETSLKYGGTGLGLAISKKFCEMMGGTIDVSSQPQAGSTFVIRIPASQPGARDVEAQKQVTAA